MDASNVALVLNASALGILGYHLLISLPQLVATLAEMQTAAHKFVAEQAHKDREAISLANDRIHSRLDRIVELMGGQFCDDGPKRE